MEGLIMAFVFENLKLLKKDMESKGWIIDSFDFHYKQQNYIVLVKLFERDEKTPKFALLKLEFLHENDFSKKLSVYANSVKLFIEAKPLREFFGIEYSNNLGRILSQFAKIFSKFIPPKVIENKKELQKEAMWNSLSKGESEDPRKKYCFSVRRNPVKEDGELGKRSPFNDNKTRISRPELYKLLGDDPTLSFRYSMNPEEEETNEEIIANWKENKSK